MVSEASYYRVHGRVLHLGINPGTHLLLSVFDRVKDIKSATVVSAAQGLESSRLMAQEE